MYLIWRVGNRQKGMGLKIMKFHGIVHMADDIENFGPPSNYDVESVLPIIILRTSLLPHVWSLYYPASKYYEGKLN